MGAANCPETPRQKMIGMMYLVLTAMLALNVSMEIINAFVTVGDSMEDTNRNFSTKIDDTYDLFQKAYQTDPGKVGANWEKAKQIKASSKELIAYIENVKSELISKVDGITVEEASKILKEKGLDGVKKKDDYTVPTEYFMGMSDKGKGGEAEKLKNKMIEFRKQLEQATGESGKGLKLGLDFTGPYKDMDKKTITWESKNFYHTVAVADLVILNKYKAEVLNAEFDVVNYLFRSVSGEYTFDKVKAQIVPKSTYVMQGGTIEADLFVAAYDSRSRIEAVVQGREMASDSGKIKYTAVASGLGPQRLSGFIKVKTASKEENLEFSTEYFVAPPMAVVSPTKMNVFYVGVDNPISVASPGNSAESVTPEISGPGNGTLTKVGPGSYTVRVKNSGKVEIAVYAKVSGRSQLMGKYEYRCKRIPSAVPFIGGHQGNGTISRDELQNADRIGVRIPDFEFQFPLPVRSFEIRTVDVNGKVVTDIASGASFTPGMKGIFKNLRKGQRVNIDDIVVSKPDGTQETLSMSLRIL